jgi:hypothetical protein
VPLLISMWPKRPPNVAYDFELAHAKGCNGTFPLAKASGFHNFWISWPASPHRPARITSCATSPPTRGYEVSGGQPRAHLRATFVCLMMSEITAGAYLNVSQQLQMVRLQRVPTLRFSWRFRRVPLDLRSGI